MGHYNMVMLGAACFFAGRPVSAGRLACTFAPFLLIVTVWCGLLAIGIVGLVADTGSSVLGNVYDMNIAVQ